MLAYVIHAEEAKYYKIAAMDVFNFLLDTFRGSLNDKCVYMFKTVLSFLTHNCRNNLFDWEDTSLLRKKDVINKIKSINKENLKVEEIFKLGIFNI
jgi:hypothetical protein